MPIAVNVKLAGKESEVVNAIRGGLGISGTMELYGIKSRLTFVRWLREHTNGEWQPSPLIELKGGEKHKWLAQHRETILDCLEIFGRERTRDMFCLTEDGTLERFLRSGAQPLSQKLTRLERVELDNKDLKSRLANLEKKMELIDTKFDIADEGQRVIKLGQRELEEHFYRFTELTARQISKLLITPLLQHTIRPSKDMGLPKPLDLNIEGLITAGRKHLSTP